MAVGVDEFAVVVVGGTVARLAVPAVTRVADGGHGTRLVIDHTLQDAVVGKVATDAALTLENEIVVVLSVGTSEEGRGDVPNRPT